MKTKPWTDTAILVGGSRVGEGCGVVKCTLIAVDPDGEVWEITVVPMRVDVFSETWWDEQICGWIDENPEDIVMLVEHEE